MKKSIIKKIGLDALEFVGNKLEHGAFYAVSFYWSKKYLKESKTDLEYVKKMNKAFPYGFSKFLPKKYLSDKDCLMYLAQREDISVDLLNNLPLEIKNDKDFVVDLLMSSRVALMNKEIIKFIDKDKELIEKLLEQSNIKNVNRFFIEYSQWRNDKEIMEKAISLNNINLYYIGDDLLNDKDFLINNNAYIYSLKLGDKLKRNKDDALDLIKNNIMYYKMIDESLMSDKDILNEVLLKYNYNIVDSLPEEAIKKIKKDKKFILKVVEHNPEIMKIVDTKLKKDDDIINKMLENWNISLEYISKTKFSQEIIEKALKKDGKELRLLNEADKSDFNIEIALNHSPLAIKFLTNDKDKWAKKYFDKNWMVIIYFDEANFLNDNDVINLLEKISKNYFNKEWFMNKKYELVNIYKIDDYCEILLDTLSKNENLKRIIDVHRVYDKKAIDILKKNESLFSLLLNQLERQKIEGAIDFKPVEKNKKINKF